MSTPSSRPAPGFNRLTIVAAAAIVVAIAVPGLDLAAEASSTEADEIKRPILYDRADSLWPFATGPSYGLRGLDRTELRKPGMLHTQVGVFDLTRGLPRFPEALTTTTRPGDDEHGYFLVQLHPDTLADDGVRRLRETIEARGGRIVGRKPIATFVARLNAGALAAAQSHVGVMGVLPYHPGFKLNPMIGRAPLPDPYRALSEVYTLDVSLFAGEDPAPVAEAIATLGGNVTIVEPGYIRVDLHRDRLAELAALEPVARIVESVPVFPKAEETTTTMQTGAYNAGAVPYHDAGVDGSGAGVVSPTRSGVGPGGEQLLMVLDTGIQLDAGDLSDTRVSPGTPGDTHRKVQLYATGLTGMVGDLLGCDATISGGVTHGHTVTATALGRATGVDENTYGAPWQAFDEHGNAWSLDGVAPGARVVAYDAQETPSVFPCGDPTYGLDVGLTYLRFTGAGSLPAAYGVGARTMNFSWGSVDNPSYYTESLRVDQFLFDYRDAMVFIAAGNEAELDDDGVPDPGSVSSPATAKSAIVVGASFNANDTGDGPDGDSRAEFSSIGPAVPSDSLLRVVPILMAPGDDGFLVDNMGVDSEFHCRTNDNDQDGPVECDVAGSRSGTSVSSAAAAGAGLLVRDYFFQGMYPDGTTGNAGNAGDQVEFMSGALTKAVLVASAEFMTGENLYEGFRFNNEQGYGRIQLDNVLPLTSWASSPTGLIVADHGDVSSSLSGPNDTSLSSHAEHDAVETFEFEVGSDGEELRIACAWVEDVPGGGSGMLDNNLDLELVAPDGTTTYFGNVFTEDLDRDDVLDGDEDCDGDGAITEGPWSLAGTGTAGGTPNGAGASLTCATANTFAHDDSNPVEALFLSPDPAGNGIEDDPDTPSVDEGADNMIRTGTWTLRVIGELIVAAGPEFQPYACAIAGPVATGSSARFDAVSFVCNDLAGVTINETDPDPVTGDDDSDLHGAGDRAAEVAARVAVQVLDATSTVVDEEGCAFDAGQPCLSFAQPDPGVLRFTLAGSVTLSDALTRDPAITGHNGVLDVRTGETLRVVYRDETAGAPDPGKERHGAAAVDCTVRIGLGDVVWARVGMDTATLVDGGCERDARGMFTFGFPDNHMDAAELIGYRVAFRSAETELNLLDAQASLRCVLADADSPADCAPDGGTCPDPRRENNPTCDGLLTVVDSPKPLGVLPAGGATSANFTIEMAETIAGTPTVEMLLGVSTAVSGKTVEGLAVRRHLLDVDERSLYYSTDFPTGGVEIRDYDNDEVAENPITVPGGGFDSNDYRFETMTWSNLTATGRNASLHSPWDFDDADSVSGFQVGIHTVANSFSLITNWGEDLNFNGLLDIGEDRDPTGTTGVLDRNWGTEGGCGWQSQADPFDPTLAGGAWHTGTIGSTTLATCLGPGPGRRCQTYEVAGGGAGTHQWMDLLKTPVIEKVNRCGSDVCQDAQTIACTTTQDCIDASASGPCVSTADPLCGSRRDEPGNPVFQVELLNWAWNTAIDLPDDLVALTWEFDTDVASISPSNLDAFPALDVIAGPFGAVAGGNAAPTDGFPLFAPTHVCTLDTSIPCSRDSDCDPPHFDPSIGPCADTQIDRTGKDGINRAGRNSCFFNQATDLPTGLVKPRDDDLNQDGATGCCLGDPLCQFVNGEWSGGAPCSNDVECVVAGFTDPVSCSAIDSYVTQAGPIRNMGITRVSGPDLRFVTLSDLYGLAGDTFQGALGFIVSEGTIGNQPQNGFGVAVDDMVVEWRETDLVDDVTECDPGAGGRACASVVVDTSNLYEAGTTFNIRVIDRTPYDPVHAVNDCDWNGSFTDPGDDTDCNDNGTDDVVVRASSQSMDVEIVALDLTATTGVYAGQLPVATTFDADGMIFVAPNGTEAPRVRVLYDDRDDGSGNPCPNSTDPDLSGTVEASATLSLTLGRVVVKSARITNDPGMGDDDAFADTNETVNMYVTVANKTGVDLNDVVMRVMTGDPRIDCVLAPVVALGVLPVGQELETPTPFVFKVASDAERSDVDEVYTASFTVTLHAREFDAALASQSVTIPLDLDVSSPGSGPTTFAEGFESTTLNLTQFTEMRLDENLDSVELSDGYRCQYNDPDGPNPNNDSPNPDCFLGFTVGHPFDWHIHDTGMPDGGRSYLGVRSLHFGVHSSAAEDDTTRLKQLDAVRTLDPINLGVDTSPELSFKHQVSMIDSRSSNTPEGQVADRAIVQIQLADAADDPVGPWITIAPHNNVYDSQGTDALVNCRFDPIDDGNDEDDYFDPGDPFRRLGPSSTCYPAWVFGCQGDTDWRSGFNPANTCRASDPPGLQGLIDRGTWVETRFDLSRFSGRRVYLRFLASTSEAGDAATYNQVEGGAGGERFVDRVLSTGLGNETIFDGSTSGDDGWYVDDVVVTGILATPAVLVVDTKNNSGLPTCGAACSTLVPDLTASPETLVAPGGVSELSAEGTFADRCVSGGLQFQFWDDGNGDGVVGDPEDLVLRDWTDNPVLVAAPGTTTDYGVVARCSTAVATCVGSAFQTVEVGCPGAVPNQSLGDPVFFESDRQTLSWATSQVVDAIRGDLDTLLAIGTLDGTVEACLAGGTETDQVTDATQPTTHGFYYLVRGRTPCGENGGWATGTDAVDRDAQIGQVACP